MEQTVFINDLKNMFVEFNRQENRYSKVWLSKPEFAQYMPSVRYVLNVKAQKHLEAIYNESTFIFGLLVNKLNIKENKFLFSVDAYNDNEPIPEEKDDIVLLEERKTN